MPQTQLHSQPTGFSLIGYLFAVLGLPFILARAFISLDFAVPMSVIMGRKVRRPSFMSDKKDSSAFEKHKTPKVNVDASCPICQEPIGSRNVEGIVEGWSILPCGHQFGSYCIKHYLRIVADDRPSCPICRQNAYHSCGHPILPLIITSGSDDNKKLADLSDMLTKAMQSSFCGYCTQTKTNNRPRGRKRQNNGRLKTACLWLLSMAARGPRKLLGRNRRHQRPSEEDNRGPLLIPWEADNGPWIDPFPRTRDHLWERWWNIQAPKGA